MRAMGLRSSPIAAPRASGCARRNTRRRRVQALRSLGSQAGGADGSGACPLGDAPPRDVQAAAATPSSTASPDAEPLASASASSCPYSAAKGAAEEVVDAVGKTARLAAARARKLPRVDLDSATFLQSVIKAATDPAGMAGAMLDWSDEHGMTVGIDNPIGPACVATVDPEVVEYVCYHNASNYKDRMLPDAFRYVTKYKGLTGSDGEYNRQHRLLCQKPFLYQPNLHDFAGVITGRVDELVSAWGEAHALAEERGVGGGDNHSGEYATVAADDGGRPYMRVDMNEHSQRVTLDIISMVAFKHDFAQVERTRREMLTATSSSGGGGSAWEPDELLDAYNESSELMGQLFITPVPLIKLMSRLGVEKIRRLEESYATLERVGMGLVDKRRNELAERAEREGGIRAECLLDTLVTATNPDGSPLSNDDLWGDINDIMAAGHRTQASAMCVALYHMSRNPDLLAAATAQVDALGGRCPTYEDVKEGRLELLERVVKEGLRLHAPINLFPRLAGGDDEMPTGHKVQKGDFILLSSYAMGRNGRVWKDPLRFDPDRFLPDNLVRMQEERGKALGLSEKDIARQVQRILNGRDFVYTPFGAGPRSCIGGSFAQMSVALILATCLQKFDFRPSTHEAHQFGEALPFNYDTTIVFTEGVHLEMRPRVDAPVSDRESEAEAEAAGAGRELATAAT